MMSWPRWKRLWRWNKMFMPYRHEAICFTNITCCTGLRLWLRLWLRRRSRNGAWRRAWRRCRRPPRKKRLRRGPLEWRLRRRARRRPLLCLPCLALLCLWNSWHLRRRRRWKEWRNDWLRHGASCFGISHASVQKASESWHVALKAPKCLLACALVVKLDHCPTVVALS